MRASVVSYTNFFQSIDSDFFKKNQLQSDDEFTCVIDAKKMGVTDFVSEVRRVEN